MKSKEKTTKITAISKVGLLQSIKAKIILMGLLAIVGAVVIGYVGMNSVNRNIKNSQVESIVNTISGLQSQNQVDEALYQHYVDQKYLDNILADLNTMSEKAAELQKIDSSYNASVQELTIPSRNSTHW